MQKLIDAASYGVTESQLIEVISLAIEKGCTLMGDDIIGYKFISENGQHGEFNTIIGVLLMWTSDDFEFCGQFFEQNCIEVLPYDSESWRK